MRALGSLSSIPTLTPFPLQWCRKKFGLNDLATPLKHIQSQQGVSQHQASLEPIEEESQSEGVSRKRARSRSLVGDFEQLDQQ